MTDAPLLYDVQDRVCRLTLNRPQVHHALNANLLDALTDAFGRIAADPAIRAVVLTAAGEQAFCSGADLKEGFRYQDADGNPNLGEALDRHYHPLIRAMRQLPKPIIGRINGAAAGAGCSLALACDVVLCADEAYFSLLFVGIGLMPDAGATFFLPRLVGTQRAFELAATGRKVYGAEAARLGLANQSVPRAELDALVTQTAGYYASAPTQAIGRLKLALNASFESTLDEQLAREADGQTRLGLSTDFAEGVTAFLSKRQPKFSGR